MRDKPWRHDKTFYQFATDMHSRYADLDTERHINNVAVLALHTEARSRFHLSLFGREGWLSQTRIIRTVRLENDFIQVSHYPAPLTGGVSLVALTDRDYTLAVGLFQEDICVGVQECRIGAWIDGAWRLLPQSMHDRLKEFGAIKEQA